MYNGVAKNFSSDKQIQTQKRNLKASPKMSIETAKPIEKQNFVLDEDFAKESRIDGDTLKWDNVPIDRTGQKYYIQSSYPITKDMRFGSRNRKEHYKEVQSGNAPITTYKPFYKYGSRELVDRDKENHQNHFIGYDKNGNFKLGPLSEFKEGDTLSQVYYKDIIDVPRDKNGKLILKTDPSNPKRKQIVVNVYGESYYDGDKVVQGKKGRGIITAMTERNNTNTNKYGNVSGGRVLLKLDDEVRIVEGTQDHIAQEIELMIKNHKGKPVRYYELDNGSYNRALRTRNNKITRKDWEDYDSQNTTSARGGHVMYIKNK